MADYRLNAAAFRAELLNAPWMVAEMDARAVKGFYAAEAEAPVDTGAYKAGLYVASGKNGGIHHDRAWAEFGASSEDAPFVEYGNGHSEGQHVITRAIGAVQS